MERIGPKRINDPQQREEERAAFARKPCGAFAARAHSNGGKSLLCLPFPSAPPGSLRPLEPPIIVACFAQHPREFPSFFRAQARVSAVKPVFCAGVAEIQLPFQVEHQIQLVGVVSEQGFHAFSGLQFVVQGEQFAGKAGAEAGVFKRLATFCAVIHVVDVIEIAGARLGQVMKKAEQNGARGIRSGCAGQRPADDGNAKGMFGHVFPTAAEKLIACTRRKAQHPGFVEKIYDPLPAASFFKILDGVARRHGGLLFPFHTLSENTKATQAS